MKTPFEVIDLVNYCKRTNQPLGQLFKTRGMIPKGEFFQILEKIGFKSKDPSKLLEALDTKGSRTGVDISKLLEYADRLDTKGKGPAMTAE